MQRVSNETYVNVVARLGVDGFVVFREGAWYGSCSFVLQCTCVTFLLVGFFSLCGF